jgi:hypothetical protein
MIESPPLNPQFFSRMKTEILSINQITDRDIKELFNLFSRYYDQTSYTTFISDFTEKQWLIRMTDGDKLAGFSTQQIYPLSIRQKPIHVLFSGDTIVHPDYWQKSHLAGAFGHLFLKIASSCHTPLYWFLITKGFRTYRFLPVFFNSYYPAFNQQTPELKQICDAIAQAKYASAYSPASGIIDPGPQKDRLCTQLATIPSHRKQNPHIAYFLQKNATFSRGTELACLAELNKENLTPKGLRVIEHTHVEWHE